MRILLLLLLGLALYLAQVNAYRHRRPRYYDEDDVYNPRYEEEYYPRYNRYQRQYPRRGYLSDYRYVLGGGPPKLDRQESDGFFSSVGNAFKKAGGAVADFSVDAYQTTGRGVSRAYGATREFIDDATGLPVSDVVDVVDTVHGHVRGTPMNGRAIAVKTAGVAGSVGGGIGGQATGALIGAGVGAIFPPLMPVTAFIGGAVGTYFGAKGGRELAKSGARYVGDQVDSRA
jgi:hypothetical protein